MTIHIIGLGQMPEPEVEGKSPSGSTDRKGFFVKVNMKLEEAISEARQRADTEGSLHVVQSFRTSEYEVMTHEEYMTSMEDYKKITLVLSTEASRRFKEIMGHRGREVMHPTLNRGS